MTMKGPISGTRWNSDSAPEKPARVQIRHVGMISTSAVSRCTTTMPNTSREPRPSSQATGSMARRSGERYDFDLDEHVARQARHLDRRTCWRSRAEIFRPAIDLVHGDEAVHALQEHGGLDGALEVAARGLQHGAQVLQHLMRLFGDTAGHEVAGLVIERDLAGTEHQAVGDDGLRIGAKRLGRGI